MTTSIKLSAAVLAGLFLAGCGGGGGGQGPLGGNFTYVPLNDPTSTEKSKISGGFVEIGTGAVNTASGGTYDRSNNSYKLDGENGTIDWAAGTGTINSGGTLTAFGAQSHVAGVTVQPNGGNTTLAYVGVPTFSGDMAGAPPTATYNGGSKVVINDGSALWSLDGTSSVSIDFVAGSGSGLIGNLDGTKADFGGGTTAVSNVANIGLNNLILSGNGFSTSTIAFSSNQIAGSVGGNATVDVQGGFFGPQAANVGGVLSVDDTTNGTVSVQGVFTGTR